MWRIVLKNTLKEKLLAELEEKGYISISVRDAFVYKRRNALNEMVCEGLVRIHFSSPSYWTYTLKS